MGRWGSDAEGGGWCQLYDPLSEGRQAALSVLMVRTQVREEMLPRASFIGWEKSGISEDAPYLRLEIISHYYFLITMVNGPGNLGF